MLELSNDRVGQILHQETLQTEELTTILRAIYTRYMRLYEKVFADIEALDDAEIARLRKYHEETRSLVKYYYLDIPQEICTGLDEFDNKDCSKMLGPDWHEFLSDKFQEFRDEDFFSDKSESQIKAEFAEKSLNRFYESMDSVFRSGFGTGVLTTEDVVKGIKHLAFGKDKG